MTATLAPVDIAVVATYLVGTTALGVRLGRRQRDARDYFVASHSIPWWAILVSVVATETSAVTFISIPGLAYIGNFTFLQLVIEETLESMPDQHRKIVEMRLEGLDVMEIAEKLGRSKRTVERLLQQARARLSVLLDEGK